MHPRHDVELRHAGPPPSTMGQVLTHADHGAPRLHHVTHGPTSADAPIVVLHGGLGWDHTYLLDALMPLAERRQVHWLDLYGNGRSSRPGSSDDWATVGHTRWVADVEAVRLTIGADQIVLLGHCYGGVLAQEYVLAYPERVCGLVLVSTYPAFDYGPEAIQRARARATPAQAEALALILSGVRLTDADFGSAFAQLLPLYVHRELEAVERAFSAVHYGAEAVRHSTAVCLPGFSALDRLPGITAPALIVSGAHSWIAPPAFAGTRLAVALPNATHRLFADSGHFPFLEESAEFTAAVLEWLSMEGIGP